MPATRSPMTATTMHTATSATTPSATTPSATTTYDCEITDTMGGEANYSWVRRETIVLPDTATDRSVVRAAKAALGITGVRCRTFEMGEGWELRPYGFCQVAFIVPRY